MFRFTFRDVLWLMVVAGLMLAWVVKQRELNDASYAGYQLKSLVTLLRDQGYRVAWNDEMGTMAVIATDPPLPRSTQPKRLPERTDLSYFMTPYSR